MAGWSETTDSMYQFSVRTRRLQLYWTRESLSAPLAVYFQLTKTENKITHNYKTEIKM